MKMAQIAAPPIVLSYFREPCLHVVGVPDHGDRCCVHPFLPSIFKRNTHPLILKFFDANGAARVVKVFVPVWVLQVQNSMSSWKKCPDDPACLPRKYKVNCSRQKTADSDPSKTVGTGDLSRGSSCHLKWAVVHCRRNACFRASLQ